MREKVRQAARKKTPLGRNNLVLSSDWALLQLVPKPPEFIEDGGEMRLKVAPWCLESLAALLQEPPFTFPFSHGTCICVKISDKGLLG